MKITANVTNSELDALEDYLVCYNLCPIHHKKTIGATDEQLDEWQNKCPKCIEERKKLFSKSLHLWSKLVHAYDSKLGDLNG